MYIDDHSADDVVGRQETLQKAIRGEIIVFQIPGLTAFLVLNLLLALGLACMGIAISAVFPRVEHIVYGLAFLAICATVWATLIQRVLSGVPSARRSLHRFASLLAAVATTLVSIHKLNNDTETAVVSAVGLVMFLVCRWLIGRTGIAIAAAFFRAKRARREQIQKVLDEI